jgi:hypothetical protein
MNDADHYSTIKENIFQYEYQNRHTEDVYENIGPCRVWGSHTGGYEELDLPGYNAV